MDLITESNKVGVTESHLHCRLTCIANSSLCAIKMYIIIQVEFYTQQKALCAARSRYNMTIFDYCIYFNKKLRGVYS